MAEIWRTRGYEHVEKRQCADDMSLRDIVLEFNPETGEWDTPTICYFRGEVLLRRDWASTVPGPNDSVCFVELPGKKNWAGIALTIALTFAAGYAGSLVSGMISSAIGGVAGSIAGLVGGAFVSGAVMYMGSMLLGKLFPTPALPNGADPGEAASPTYSHSNAGNQARLGQPIPVWFGHMKVVPDVVANPYATYEDNDQYLHQVFMLAWNPVQVEAMYFGETLFWQKAAVDKLLAQKATAVARQSYLETRLPVARQELNELMTNKVPPYWTTGKRRRLTKDGTAKRDALNKEIKDGETELKQLALDIKEYDRLIKGGGVDSPYEVDWEFYNPGESVRLFPDNTETSIEIAGQELLPPNNKEFDGPIGPYTTNSPGTTTQRIMFNFQLPMGDPSRLNDKGGRYNVGFSYKIEVRRINDMGEPEPGAQWQTIHTETLNSINNPPNLTARRFTVSCQVPSGRYQAQVVRTSNVPQDERTNSRMNWESMTAYIDGTIKYNQHVVALRTKANNALSQNASKNFTLKGTGEVPLYDRRTKKWSDYQPTRSFAGAMSYVARWKYGCGLPDNQIDLDSLWAIDEKLAAKDWTFDGYFDGSYLNCDLISQMCEPYGVVWSVPGGILSFTLDQADRPVKHVFTPENIVRGSLQINYCTEESNSPDSVLLEYLDEAADFESRDVLAKLPQDAGLQPSSITFIGGVKRQQVYEQGIRKAACNRHRRVNFSWKTEGVGRLICVGDVVILHHPYFDSGYASGMLEGWDENSLTLHTDNEMAASAAGCYVALNLLDGSVWGPCRVRAASGRDLRLDPADYGAIRSQGGANPFENISAGFDGFPTIFSLHTAKEMSHRAIITGVKPNGLYSFELSAMIDDPKAYDYQGLTAPIWQWRANGQEAPSLDTPTGLEAKGRGSRTCPTVTLTWLAVNGATSYEVQTSCDAGPWTARGTVRGTSFSITPPRGVLAIRVRAVNESWMGLWAKWSDHTDTLFPEPPVLEMEVVPLDGDVGLAVTWLDVEASFKGYALVVKNGATGATLRAEEFGEDDDEFQYTGARMQADGGPFRSYVFELTGIDLLGDPVTVTETVNIPAPDPPTSFTARLKVGTDALLDAEFAAGGSVAPVTGYVALRGNEAGFGADGAAETRTLEKGELPYTWTGLAPGAQCWFRLAARDAVYDLGHNAQELRYSEALAVTVPPAGGGA